MFFKARFGRSHMVFRYPFNQSLVSACCVPGSGHVPVTCSGEDSCVPAFVSQLLAWSPAPRRCTHLQQRKLNDRGRDEWTSWVGAAGPGHTQSPPRLPPCPPPPVLTQCQPLWPRPASTFPLAMARTQAGSSLSLEGPAHLMGGTEASAHPRAPTRRSISPSPSQPGGSGLDMPVASPGPEWNTNSLKMKPSMFSSF